jgi:hypothetical protein
MQATGGTSRRREYPYQVRDLTNLPDGLRQLAEGVLPLDDPAETIFVIPGQMLSKKFGGFGGVHWVPEQALLFTAQGVIHVQAGKSAGEVGQANYLPGASLLYARMSLVILYARMELCGGINDNMIRIVVEYNSVSHELMQPAFLNFLRLTWKLAQVQEANNYQNLLMGRLEEQSYKFSSGLEKHCLQAGEYLQGFVFQPRIFKHYLRIFHRLIAPASLLALTDRQLILIEEGMTSATSYGYFFTFCPRANVVNVDTKPNDKLQEVRVQLRKDAMNADFQVAQEMDNAFACQDLWAKQ